jgi:hypothetical protein
MTQMDANAVLESLSLEDGFQGFDDDEKVSLSSLSELTGFPVDFIKKELLLEEEPISMNELRHSVLRYLETTAEDLDLLT